MEEKKAVEQMLSNRIDITNFNVYLGYFILCYYILFYFKSSQKLIQTIYLILELVNSHSNLITSIGF